MSHSFSELPTAAKIALVALVLLNVVLDLWALVDLSKRERVAGGRRWLWALIILFVSTFGAILYLVIGRKVPEAAADPLQQARGSSTERTQRAVDALYGTKERR